MGGDTSGRKEDRRGREKKCRRRDWGEESIAGSVHFQFKLHCHQYCLRGTYRHALLWFVTERLYMLSLFFAG